MSEATTPKLLAIGRFLLKHGVLSGGVGAGTLVDHADSDTASAQEFVNDLEALGPTFIKLGQLLSTRSDLIPPHYIDPLRRLQDAVDPVPIEDIKTTIEEELGADLRHLFAEFEEDPQASGSLAQVHRATLRDGTPVAVKVQRPGIKRRIYEDISALEKVVGAAERVPAASVFNPSDTLDQFRRSITGELDFLREAHSLIEFQDLMDDFDLISVPKPYLDYTTSRVLTMDYVDGKSILDLGDLGRLEMAGEALADQLISAYLRQVFVEGFVHADPHPGNLLITADGRLNIIDLGMTTPIEPSVRRSMLALVLASVSGDSARAGRLLEDLGERQENYDKERFRDALSALIGEYLHAPPGAKKPGRLLLQVTGESAACGLAPPVQLSVLGRTLLSLDWVSEALAPDLDVNMIVERHALELMERHSGESISPETIFQTMLDTGRLAEELPERVDRLTEALANGEFRLKVDAVDERGWQQTLHGAANRLTFGIVVAALIVGSALLVRVDTNFKLFGYPGLSAIFFLVGALSGIALLITIWRERN